MSPNPRTYKTWAKFIAPYVRRCGGPAAFASQYQLGLHSVSDWMMGKSTPYVRTIVRLADLVGYDLDFALRAANRPPLRDLRQRIGFDAHTSLPMLLCAFREENGFDTMTAAACIGVGRHEFSRLANGSAVPRSLRRVHQCAEALELRELDIIEAAGITDRDLVDRVLRATTGFAAFVRTRLEAIGVDSWDEDEVREVVESLGLDVAAFLSYLTDGATPGLIVAQKLAGLFEVDSAVVLVAAGMDPGLAYEIAGGLADARRLRTGSRRRSRWGYQSLGQLLSAYRICGELSSAELATQLGYAHHASVLRWESDECTPDVATIARLASALGAPLGRLLEAAKLVV